MKDPLFVHRAAIYKNGKLFYLGKNSSRTTYDGKYSGFVSTHAEMDVLHKSKGNIPKNAMMVVIRISKDLNGKTKLSNSAPCKNCTEKMRNMGIKKLAFSNEKGEIVTCKLRDYETDHISSGQKYLKN